MSTEQLTGLLLAQIGNDDSDAAIAAVHAAADERDELRAKYDELLVALHGIGAALGIPEGDRSPYSVTCGVLERVNRLAEIEAQEPVATAWMKGGAMVNAFNRPPAAKFDHDGYWTSKGYSESPLYARPVPAQAVPDVPNAACDVLAERRRQVSAEGYDHQHDDSHVCDEIAAAACFFAMPPGAREWDTSSTGYGDTLGDAIVPDGWVLSAGSRRRDLVKAGALILAEIERMDRAAIAKATGAAQAVPDGWRLVPVEPTDEMLTAAARASMQHLIDCIHDPRRAKEVGSEEMCKRTHASRYRSMIAAAPEHRA